MYLRLQFKLLEPRDGSVSLDNFRTVSYEDISEALLMSSCLLHVLTSKLPWRTQALTRYLTDAMRESRVLEFLHAVRIHHYAKDYTVMLSVPICSLHLIIVNCNVEMSPHMQL